MKCIFYLLALLFVSPLFLFTEGNYRFIGRHLIISYVGCDEAALKDEEQLKEKMREAAASSGVTILSSCAHHFEPAGVTQVLLLSESHASIHTYPEHQSCFVDLFTCGNSFAMDKFDQILTEYLKPSRVSHKLLKRQEESEEIAFVPSVQVSTL